MATEKSELWQFLKTAGALPEGPFVNYKVDELKVLAAQALAKSGQIAEVRIDEPTEDPEADNSEAALEALAAELTGGDDDDEPADEEFLETLEAVAASSVVQAPPVAQAAPLPAPTPAPAPEATPAPERPRLPRPQRPRPTSQGRPGRPALPPPPRTWEDSIREMQEIVKQAALAGWLAEGRTIPWTSQFGDVHSIEIIEKNADRAGMTHSTPVGQPIRVDLNGRIWFRDEVPKPAVPKPRMTRTQRYIDPGVKQERTYLPDGHLDEVYEVAGDSHREMTVKTTIGSYQVGEYRDPRFPFNIHTYNGLLGFSFSAINEYYGGLELVPRSVKTLYVGPQLCYSLSSARETIMSQYNTLRRER